MPPRSPSGRYLPSYRLAPLYTRSPVADEAVQITDEGVMLRLVEYVRTCMYVCEPVHGMSNILESLKTPGGAGTHTGTGYRERSAPGLRLLSRPRLRSSR